MEQLQEVVLLIIVKKVAAYGTQNLFRFKATHVYHQKLPTRKKCLRLYQETVCGTFLTTSHA